MRTYSVGLSILALAALAPASTAQVVVIVKAQNNTNSALRAGNRTSVSGWVTFDKEPVAPGETLTFATKPKMFRGAEGNVELVTVTGERAATVRFDFPYVGNDTAILELTPGFYGYIDHEDEGLSRHVLHVDLRRLVRPPVVVVLPRTGSGVVRGRISWDTAHIQARRSPTRGGSRPSETFALKAQSIAEIIKKALQPTASAPTEFAELDPSEFRPNTYQGKQGLFVGRLLRVGQVRWLKSDANGVDFEIYDLPLDVLLRLRLTPLEDLGKRFEPGDEEKAPRPSTLIPPAQSAPKFSVRLEYASPFSGPLTDATPRYDSFNVSLQPLWVSEDNGDGSGALSLDAASAKMQETVLSRINPSPLKGAGGLKGAGRIKLPGKLKDRK